MLITLLQILIIVVIGGICFWAIDKFCTDARLGYLLKALAVIVCLIAALIRLAPLLGVGPLI